MIVCCYMDHLPCHVWIISALIASWLVCCQTQSSRYFRDSRLLYPVLRRASPSRQQLWGPVYGRAGPQPDIVHSTYVGQPLDGMTAPYIGQPVDNGNRVYVRSLYPNNRAIQFRRDDLSYLIPKKADSGGYLASPLFSVSGPLQFDNPSYARLPVLTTPTPRRFKKPSYLDPSNFRTPDMTLEQMEATLTDIEKHIKAKEIGNPDEYTGSRVLILLLREQCARLARSGDPDLLQFCSQFDSRFRSFLF